MKEFYLTLILLGVCKPRKMALPGQLLDPLLYVSHVTICRQCHLFPLHLTSHLFMTTVPESLLQFKPKVLVN